MYLISPGRHLNDAWPYPGVLQGTAAPEVLADRELTGVRNLGSREGIWATNRASQSLAAAYAALRIRWEVD